MMRLLLLLVVCATQALFSEGNSDKWDGLKVTWGLNPLNSFKGMPRTRFDAQDQGWRKISDCDPKGQWRGARYVKDEDYSVILLFDVQGFIAGIQTSVPNNLTDGYPKPAIRPPFLPDQDRLTITAYFWDPKEICTTGRTANHFAYSGTGNDLYIQTSENPEESMKIEKDESKVDQSEWTKGQCFYTMGNHYWHQLDVDMDCDSYLPVFLLYNKGRLNAFGWALFTGLTSPRYEHPTSKTFKLFMKEPPKCLYAPGRAISTMHIYLTDSPRKNFC